MVFIGRIDMRFGPPKSVFWDPGVVLRAFSIEVQQTTSTGVGFWCAYYVNDFKRLPQAIAPRYPKILCSAGSPYLFPDTNSRVQLQHMGKRVPFAHILPPSESLLLNEMT